MNDALATARWTAHHPASALRPLWPRSSSSMPKSVCCQRIAAVAKSANAVKVSPYEFLGPARSAKSHWVSEDRGSRLAAVDQGYEYCTFTVNAPGRHHIWYHRLDMPIDVERYPVLVLRYCARNTDAAGQDYVLAAIERGEEGRRTIGIILQDEVEPDSDEHEVRKDLRDLDLASPVRGLALRVAAAENVSAPATIEVRSIHFLRAPDAIQPEPLREDKSVTVQVVDADGKPIPEANVVIDAERINFASAGSTDAEGLASVTPLAADSGVHMLRVERDGYAPAELGRVESKGTALQIPLLAGGRYGGVVQDDNGGGVHGAVIHVSLVIDVPLGLRVQTACSVLSDRDGEWQTPVMPTAADAARLVVYHPEHKMTSAEVPSSQVEFQRLAKLTTALKLPERQRPWSAADQYCSIPSVLALTPGHA